MPRSASSTCSAASAASASGLNEPAGSAPSRSANGTGSAGRSSRSTGRASRYSETSPRSTGELFEGRLTSSLADSLANRFLQLHEVGDEARLMTATSGLRCAALLTRPGLASSWARTCLTWTGWHSMRWFLTWKVSATKSRHRLKFRLVPSDSIIGGRASGFSHTPTATANQSCPSMQKWPGCRTAVVTPQNWERQMGFPDGWTDIASRHSATRSAFRSSKPSGGRS